MWEECFFVEEVLLWIMDSCVDLKLKSLNDGFFSYEQLFTSHDINWWTGVMMITVMF